MDPLFYVARIVHVVGAISWAGGVLYSTHFVEPALRECGTEGMRVEQAIRRRHAADATLSMALLTLLSGFWLYLRSFGGAHAGPGAPGPHVWFGVGGLLALAAFLIELVVTRRRQGTRVASRVVVGLLTITMICMAVGRYS
jgi:uncharacterized membrane protein